MRSDESVEELADTNQAFEAAAVKRVVEGVEDAADHPERPVHTHLEYGRRDDLPPEGGRVDTQAARARTTPADWVRDVEVRIWRVLFL